MSKVSVLRDRNVEFVSTVESKVRIILSPSISREVSQDLHDYTGVLSEECAGFDLYP